MRIILLGTGTTLPHKNRNAAGLLIQIHKNYLLFDCGNGILRQIEKVNIDFTKIRDIFISHLHADHINDLPILLKANLMKKNPNTVKIYGPPPIKKVVEEWFSKIYLYLNKILYQIEIHEVKDEWIKNIGWKVQGFPVQHGIKAYGFKLVSNGKKLVYSGDTGFCEELIRAAKDADVLIHECSYPTGYEHGKDHTTPLELGQIAKQANVKQVVLTHFYPVCSGHEEEFIKEIRSEYSGKIVIGEDLLEIVVK
ncbi:MAG: MBL fold metallo-hydrolase [Promethearchaeota archaeon]